MRLKINCLIIFILLILIIPFIISQDYGGDRFIIEVNQDNILDQNIKDKVVDEVKESSKLSKRIQVASTSISLSQPKKLVIEGLDEDTIKEDKAIIYIPTTFIFFLFSISYPLYIY